MPSLGSELNTSNFIRWRKATSLPLADLEDATLSNDTSLFPNQYIKDQKLYYPKILIDSPVAVYANLTTPATDADFANWSCVYADRYGATTGGFTVTKDDLGSGNFRWYFSQTPTTSEITADDYFRFVIYNTSTMNVVYASNFFQAVAAADYYKYAYASYRNGSTLDRFNYTTLTSWRNIIALDLNLIDSQPIIEQTDFPEITTGDVQVTKTYKRLERTFKAFQFDNEAKRALESLYSCSDILINTNEMKRNEAPQWEENQNTGLHDGTFKLWDQSYSEINLNGYDG